MNNSEEQQVIDTILKDIIEHHNAIKQLTDQLYEQTGIVVCGEQEYIHVYRGIEKIIPLLVDFGVLEGKQSYGSNQSWAGTLHGSRVFQLSDQRDDVIYYLEADKEEQHA